jgi:hypothetical protein
MVWHLFFEGNSTMEYPTDVDLAAEVTLTVQVGTRTYHLNCEEVRRYEEALAQDRSVEDALSHALYPFRVDL